MQRHTNLASSHTDDIWCIRPIIRYLKMLVNINTIKAPFNRNSFHKFNLLNF